MNDEAQDSGQATLESTNTKTAGQKPAGGDDVKRLRSELDGVHKSAQQWKKEAEQYRKQVDEINANKQRAAEEKAKQAGEHEKIIAEREKTIAELQKDLDSTRHTALVSNASSKLAGMVKSEFARKALAAEWAAKPSEEREIDGAFEAFIEAAKKSDPGTFEVPLSNVNADRVGSPEGSGNKSLEQRIADGDMDAINAHLRQMMGMD